MGRAGQAPAAVYTEDGILSAFYAPDIIGRQAIAEILTQTLAPIQFIIQSCTAGVINVDGDAAHASWSVTEQLRFRDKEDLSCRSEEHTSELQSLMRISYAFF